MEEQNVMVRKARNLMLLDKIDPDEYKEIKRKADAKITALETRVTTFNEAIKDINGILNNALEALIKLGTFFKDANLKVKRLIVGSIFSEKLIFEHGGFRTTKVGSPTKVGGFRLSCYFCFDGTPSIT